LIFLPRYSDSGRRKREKETAAALTSIDDPVSTAAVFIYVLFG
jgi:hypothetical protein